MNQIEKDREIAIKLSQQFEQDYDQYNEEKQQEEDFEGVPFLKITKNNILDIKRCFNLELQKSKVCKLDEVRCMHISQEMLQLQDETQVIINFLKVEHRKLTSQKLIPLEGYIEILLYIEKFAKDA